MQLKRKKSDGLFPGLWSLPEGSMVDGQFTGDLVRGIIEDNYIDPHSFSFTKSYNYIDEKTKKKYVLFVFSRKFHVPLLKITLVESERIDYISLDELKTLPSPEIIKTIVKESLQNA